MTHTAPPLFPALSFPPGWNPAMALRPPAPPDPDPEFGPGIIARLTEIMSVDADCVSQQALYELGESVADAFDLGKVGFKEHDRLLKQVNAALDSLI